MIYFWGNFFSTYLYPGNEMRSETTHTVLIFSLKYWVLTLYCTPDTHLRDTCFAWQSQNAVMLHMKLVILKGAFGIASLLADEELHLFSFNRGGQYFSATVALSSTSPLSNTRAHTHAHTLFFWFVCHFLDTTGKFYPPPYEKDI